jgi:hypothetical protein
MKILKEIKKIPKTNYSSSSTLQPGWFGVTLMQKRYNEKKLIPHFQWYSCRDSFQNIKNSDIKNFFFVHNGLVNTINFMQYVEKQLKISSTFAKTNNDKVIWFKPDTFWINSLLHRSFMTFMLRCSLNFRDDFTNAIIENPNSAACYPAINRFLSGATEYRKQTVEVAKGSRGWCYLFNNKNSRQVGQLLMKPLEKLCKN